MESPHKYIRLTGFAGFIPRIEADERYGDVMLEGVKMLFAAQYCDDGYEPASQHPFLTNPDIIK